jgi:tetratricopeptide (TPR) repeat protein
MATDTTWEGSSGGTASDGTPPLRQLWQVPTFLAGLLAVASACAALPLHKENPLSEMDRDIAAIRHVLEKPQASVAPVLDLAQDVLKCTDQELGQAGEAHFLLGSVLQRLADQSPAARAATLRDQAFFHLEQAEKQGVPATDRPSLNYRLGKAWFQKNKDPDQVVAYLAHSVAEAADDPAEGYRMLAQAYMRLPVPNLDAALSANMKLFALPIDDEKILGPARLMSGEILFQQKNLSEALKMLSTIAAEAPHSLRVRAHYLQGRCCQGLHLYGQAIPFWKEVLKESEPPPDGQGPIWYYLGVCYHHLEPPKESDAAYAWGKIWKDDSESGQAAALGLADLYLLSPASITGTPITKVGALQAFRQALGKVAGAKDYHNTFVDLKKTRRLIERACDVYRGAHDYELALELVELYQKIAVPGAAQELEAQIAETWAEDLKAQSPTAGPTEKARAQFLRAGRALQAFASSHPEAEQPRVLWRSASCYLRGQHYAEAAKVLEGLLSLNVSNDQRGEGWFKLAEARLALARNDTAREAALRTSAWEALEMALRFPGPFAFRARYQMALAKMRFKSSDAALMDRHLDEAENYLKENLDPKGGAAPPDIHEKSLYQLAGLYYRRHNWERAAIYLQDAVEQYPGNTDYSSKYVLQAREKLAECYNRMADHFTESLKEDPGSASNQVHWRNEKSRYAEKALTIYENLETDLASALRPGPGDPALSPDEQDILRRTSFAAVDLQFELGNFEGALSHARILAKRYEYQVECLTAYQNIFRCCIVIVDNSSQLTEEARADKYREARAALDKALAALNGPLQALPDDAFRCSAGTLMTRQEWDTWIRERAQEMRADNRK